MERTTNNKKLIQGLLVIVGVVVLVSGISLLMDRQETSPPAEERTQSEATPETDLTVSVEIEDIRNETTLELPPDSTVLDALEKLDMQSDELQLETESYEGMGTLVTGMGGMQNGTNDEYWQYTVNGEMPMVGVDAYELSDSDTVRWEFKASEF